MATNIRYEHCDQIALAVTDPASPGSGDPVLVGELPGVALIDEQADGLTTVKLNGAADLSVQGYDGTANAAITAGDIVYYNSGASPVLNVNTGGVRYGYALQDVASGATATIPVKIGY